MKYLYNIQYSPIDYEYVKKFFEFELVHELHLKSSRLHLKSFYQKEDDYEMLLLPSLKSINIHIYINIYIS